MLSTAALGEISTEPTFKQVTTTKEKNVELATYELKNSAEKILVSTWRRHNEIAISLRQGGEIVKNTSVKDRSLRRLMEISRAKTMISCPLDPIEACRTSLII